MIKIYKTEDIVNIVGRNGEYVTDNVKIQVYNGDGDTQRIYIGSMGKKYKELNAGISFPLEIFSEICKDVLNTS